MRELLIWLVLGVVALPITAIAAALFIPRAAFGPLVLLAAWLAGGALVRLGIRAVGGGTGRAFRAFLWPSGSGAPPVYDFSLEQALVQRGDVAGALALYEERIAAAPDDVAARLRAAELYAGAGSDPRRAAALFVEARRLPCATTEHDVRASNRLVDLYAGPLGEPGRALVELRRLADSYPKTRLGEQARAAIARIKEEERIGQGSRVG